jgi:hypothetical protein
VSKPGGTPKRGGKLADIAQLGFAADTSDLRDAQASLKALVPAAKAAETATGKVEKALTDAGTAADRMARGVTGADAALDRAAAGASAEATAMNQAASAIERKVTWLDRLINRLRGVPAAAQGAAAGVKGVTAAANDNVNAFKSYTGNIAAQFQDIGVTAAMGMNPLLIALQQGTQLSAVFAQSGGNAFKTIGAAIGQVLSPSALFTIGIVAAVAALVQYVDWVNTAKWALNGLADILPVVAPYAVALAAGLALIYAPAILRGIWSLVQVFGALAVSIYATLGLPGLLIAGLISSKLQRMVLILSLVVLSAVITALKKLGQ